jgi:hypothetical protein
VLVGVQRREEIIGPHSLNHSEIVMTRQRLERETDIYFSESASMPCDETCLTDEDNNFVGATGRFNEDWDIVLLRSDRLPKGY